MRKKPLEMHKRIHGWAGRLLFVLLFAGSWTLPAAAALKTPDKQVEPAVVFRFGTAAVGDRLTHQFPLRNATTNLMEVKSVTPSCSCITVTNWTAYVEAGTTGAVEILFVPDQAGRVDYRIQVNTAGPDQPEIEYAVQGLVTGGSHPAMDRDWTLYLGPEEAEQAIQDPDSVTWVDVRGNEAYHRVRVPNSLHIPLYAVKTKQFLRNRRVVLLDEGVGSHIVEKECRKLREAGFSDLRIWYGGLNAWRSLGGALERNGHVDINLVPPVAVHTIAYSTDWLVVVADEDAGQHRAQFEHIPFDATNTVEFTSALNSALEARPDVVSVLMATDTGKEYGAIEAAAAQINAYVFFLDGGWAAWEAQRQMMGARPRSQTVVSTGTGRGGGKAGGCGGCPN